MKANASRPGVGRLRRNCRWALALVLVLYLPGLVAAEKPQETNAPAPPRLVVALPPVVVRGMTNALVLRGERLNEMTRLEWRSRGQTNEVVFSTATNAPPPERYKAEQTGDQQVEIALSPGGDLPSGTNLFLTGFSTLGAGPALPLFVVEAGELDDAFKPAKGFREAPALESGRYTRGTLDGRREVAVFRIDGRKEQRLRMEIWAQRLGSTLDAALTLHDSRGAVLRMVDDTEGRDPVLDIPLPADGTYFVSLAGMDERNSPTHVYLLRMDLK